MESDDDFLSPGQRYRQMNRPAVSSSSQQASQPSTSRQRPVSQSVAAAMSQLQEKMRALAAQVQNIGGDSQPSTSSQPTARMISELNEGVSFMMERVSQMGQDSRGTKRPATQRPVDKKPDIKEQCLICKKYYANKNNLFKHYRAQHVIMNPEVYHGCTVDNNIVNLDESIAAASQSILDRASISNKENVVVNAINKMYKCEECGGYFEERKKLDDHMKAQHGYEFTCQTCHKHLLYKDVDAHVKESHPDVYKKSEEEKVKKLITEKVKIRNGKRVRVFTCTECNIDLLDKNQADRHARGHKKGKIRAVRTVPKARNIDTVPTNVGDVILKCAKCDTATGSYDVAVAHSQKHLTTPDVEFVTQACEICELKFEPLCYKKHIDLHYNKELHKESFKYYAYRFEMLLTQNWLDSFDMNEPAMKIMEEESIYKHTRSVIMRVTQEGVYKLYKCCQCYTYVAPAAVLNHTQNFDTCLKIKTGFECEICSRKFHNRVARNNHRDLHKSEDSYKIVLFNHENDKGVNEMLNNPRLNEAQNEAVSRAAVQPQASNQAVQPQASNQAVQPQASNQAVQPQASNQAVQPQASNQAVQPQASNQEPKSLHAPGTSKESTVPAAPNAPKEANDANKNTRDANNNADATKNAKVYKCQSCSLCFLQEENAQDHAKICPGKGERKSCPKCDNCFNTDDLLAHCFGHHVNETEIVIETFTPEVIVIESDDEDIIEIDSSDDESERLNIKLEVLNVERAAIVAGLNGQRDNQNNALEGAAPNAADKTANQTNSEAQDIDEDGATGDNEFGGRDNDMSDDSQDTINYVREDGTEVPRSPHDNTRDELKLVPINLLLSPLHFANDLLSRNIKKERTEGIETVRQEIEQPRSLRINDTVIKQENPWLFDPTNFSYISKRRSLREFQPTSSTLSETVIQSLLTDDESDEPVNDISDLNNSNSQAADQTLTESTVVETVIHNDTVNNIEADANTDEVQAELINNDIQRAANNTTPPNLLQIDNNRQDYSDDEDDLFEPSGVDNRERSHELGKEKEVLEDVPENPEVSDRALDLSNHDTTEPDIVGVVNIPSENDRFVGNNEDTINEDENTRNSTEDTTTDIEADKENYISADNTLSNHSEHTIDKTNSNNTDSSNFSNIMTPEIVSREKPKETSTDNANIKKVLDMNVKKQLIDKNDDSTDTVQIKTEPTEEDDTESVILSKARSIFRFFNNRK